MSNHDDNRRRIKPELLKEIEEFEGKTFTEQLLNWHRKQDTLSEEQLQEKFDRAMDKLRDKLNDSEGKHRDMLSIDDVDDAVSRAIERDLPEVLRNEMM